METQTTSITRPTEEQLEDTWAELMQGMGLFGDGRARDDLNELYDILYYNAADGFPIMDQDREPLTELSSELVAERMCRAYAQLMYGI